jgi:hypothetical protein
MSELARRRRGRDIWISRGHVWAAVVACLLMGLGGFLLGWWAAGGRAVSPVVSSSADQDEALIDLLARIDARVVAQDGLDALTFPEALTGVGQAPVVPEGAQASHQTTKVAAGVGVGRAFEVWVKVEASRTEQAIEALTGMGVEAAERDGAVVIAAGDNLRDVSKLRSGLQERLEAEGFVVQVEVRESVPPAPPSVDVEGAAP